MVDAINASPVNRFANTFAFAIATLGFESKGRTMAQKKTSKRELIDTGRDKAFVRRDEKGRFDEVVNVGRSLMQDRRQHSQKVVPPGQGDRGDQKRRS